MSEARRDCANEVSADWSAGGSSRPRFAARRRMPAAARGESENLGGALGSSTSAKRGEDEDATPSLRDAVVASVEDSVRQTIPEVCQPTGECGEIGTAVRGE